jgi:hypothetical protein
MFFERLPAEIFVLIIRDLSKDDICFLRLTCRQFQERCNEKLFLYSFDASKIPKGSYLIDKIQFLTNVYYLRDLPKFKLLKYLSFDPNFNRHLTKTFPSTIKYLVFPTGYNRCLDNLPQNLNTLVLGFFFNQKVYLSQTNIKNLIFESFYPPRIDFDTCDNRSYPFSVQEIQFPPQLKYFVAPSNFK